MPKKTPGADAPGVLQFRLVGQQALLGGGVEEVDELVAEGEAHLGAVGHTGAELGGQLGGLDTHNHVLLLLALAHGGVEVELAAHQLGHLNGALDGVAALGLDGDVLGTHAHDHVGIALALGGQLLSHLVGDRDGSV